MSWSAVIARCRRSLAFRASKAHLARGKRRGGPRRLSRVAGCDSSTSISMSSLAARFMSATVTATCRFPSPRARHTKMVSVFGSSSHQWPWGKQVSKLTRADRLFKKSHELFDIFGRQHAAEACTVVVDQMPHPSQPERTFRKPLAQRSFGALVYPATAGMARLEFTNTKPWNFQCNRLYDVRVVRENASRLPSTRKSSRTSRRMRHVCCPARARSVALA
jgi:hypothetical protein